MKKTKIICTMGPATDNVSLLQQMMQAGMDLARFNFSHGNHEDHALQRERARLSQPLRIPRVLRCVWDFLLIIKFT